MAGIASQATLTDRTILAGREALDGRRRGLRTLLPFAGPAVIASVAYMDPGNFATNIQAGAKYDYNLLWVVVIANIIAMIFQALSAKLGIVTGRNLAELCREQFPQPLVWGMWVGSEIGAMATDVAEFLGGATVMPHAIFLHSGLTQSRVLARTDGERKRLLQFSHREVMLALGLGGLVNIAMVAMAASVFHGGGHEDVAQIDTAYRTLIPVLGSGAAGVFLVSLIASGLSSSAVGTMAGQVIMQGFVGFRIPLWLRRVVTMAPSFAIVALGVDATEALVLSQVVLSLILPIPMVALLILTQRRDVMGSYANGRLMTMAALAAAAAVLMP